MASIIHIDGSHRAELHKVGVRLGLMALVLLAFWFAPLPAELSNIASYVQLHTLVETLAIVVSGLIVSVAWGGRSGKVAGSVTVLACTFAAVSLLDFSHLMSYQGMPDYFTPSHPEKAILFWLASRLPTALVLLWVALAPWQPAYSRTFRAGLLAFALALAGLAHWLILLHPELIPRTFIAAQGLTAFKIHAEYLIVGINLCAAGALLLRMRAPLPFNAAALLGAVLSMAMSELFFTIYGSVTDVLNLTGHIYKVVSCAYLYQLVFLDAIERPYRKLEALQEQLKATLDAVPDLIFEVDLEGRYISFHSPASDLLVAPPEHWLGRTVAEVMPREATAVVMQAIREGHAKGFASGYQMPLDLPTGQHWFELSVARKATPAGALPRLIVLSRDITESLRAREALRESEQRYRTLFEHNPHAMWVYDPGTLAFLDVNEAAVQSYGYTRDEFLAMTIRDIRPTDDVAELEAELAQGLTTGPARVWRHRRKDGSIILAEVWARTLILGDQARRLVLAMDVTEREALKEQLAQSARHTQTILDNAVDGIITIDRRGIINSFNIAATNIFGYSAEEVLGRNVTMLMPEPYRSEHDGYLRNYAATGIRRVIGIGREVQARHKLGGTVPISLAVSEIERDGQPMYIAMVRDITQRRMAEAEIERLAFYDQLTELPNRRLLLDRLTRALPVSDRSHQLGALLFLDLDQFKLLNDTWGHDYGDRMLVQVAQRLRACVREVDTVARLGGDEFVVMLENIGETRELAASRAEAVARKVLAAFEQPFRLNEHEQHSSPSLGITLFGEAQVGAGELMAQADTAMYQAKSQGRNTYRFFDAELQAALAAKAALDADLRLSIAQHELQLYYQPQIECSGHIVGVEALLRWTHAERGPVSPAQFIPLAEQNGFILELGHWVLDTACRTLASWSQRPRWRELSMSVNVSARQLRHAQFVDWVLAALAQSGARPDLLKLELTESMLVEDIEDIIAKMSRLKEHGVGFSLDDFGTGYSSLNYLKRLPLDDLKIDQSFVRDVLVDVNDAAIARTVVALGQTFGLTVIAEGVETEGQRAFLDAIGCHIYQGYLFSRPLPEAQLESFVEGAPEPL